MGSDSRSKTDDVQRQLRADILNGRLAPGAKLPFAELRNRYQCSTGVIREALPRLVGEGLVTSEPQLGFRVVAVSVDDLRQLTESRVIIETMVLRRSIEEGDVAWEARIMGAHHVLASLPILTEDGTVSLDWTAAHADFHAALLEACSNTRLRNIANLLRDGAEVYRCWSHNSYQPQERDIPAEHRRILEAALNRDADAAAAALTGHIELTTEILLRSQRTGAATGGAGQDAAETALPLRSGCRLGPGRGRVEQGLGIDDPDREKRVGAEVAGGLAEELIRDRDPLLVKETSHRDIGDVGGSVRGRRGDRRRDHPLKCGRDRSQRAVPQPVASSPVMVPARVVSGKDR
jgi:DNA-binding GntR family transcriptional regulator